MAVSMEAVVVAPWAGAAVVPEVAPWAAHVEECGAACEVVSWAVFAVALALVLALAP